MKILILLGDFTKKSVFKNLDNDYDYCYMLASVVGVNNAPKIPSEIIRINTLLILNTLEWLKGGQPRVLFLPQQVKTTPEQ